MKAEYTLKPNVYTYCCKTKEFTELTENEKYSFLEIGVSRINFITDKSIKAQTSAASLYESPGQPKPKASSSLFLKHSSSGSAKSAESEESALEGVGAVTAKIIWCGEQWGEIAARVSISCDAACSRSRRKCRTNGIKKLSAHREQSPSRRQQQHHQHNSLHHHHNKLRYSVRTKSLALFLDFLRECPSIEFVAKSSGNSSSKSSSSSKSNSDDKDHAHIYASSKDQLPTPKTPTSTLTAETEADAARLSLPAPLQRKYAANNDVNGCNFEYKTKIYALYRHVQISGTSSQVQQQQQLKVAPIQLRFKMLFAAAAASANKTVRIGAATVPLPLPLPPPTSLPAALLQDHQLTSNNNNNQNIAQSQPGGRISGTVKSKGSAVVAPAKIELMEAMKKLDADLVALFATAGEPTMEQLKKQQHHQHHQHQQLWPEQELTAQQLPVALNGVQDQATPELFNYVNALQLHLEALTLQAEGTKRMELLQSEVRPIFTVECQLSKELICAVPRHDNSSMFHLMQFESEKFQSLTQCTRFGQTQQRQVQLPQQDRDQEMGSIQFTIWWREPGTCLNELLGMGRLPLAELHQASLLEQCKCIVIQRRDLHLASLYLKISLRVDPQLMANETNNNNNSNNNNSYHSAAAAANGNNSNNNSKSSASTQTSALPPPSKTNNNSNSNNKASLESVNFMAETNRVRLLRGYIYASETRELCPAAAAACQELHVVQPFWQPQPLCVPRSAEGVFPLHEQFAIINDDKFLDSVERQQLLLELRPLGGKVKLPLHQFYIAYKDATITNHLCKGKLPVISIDGWTPILHPETLAPLGELKVLLAIGSESQIAQLKQSRGFQLDSTQPMLKRTTDLMDMLQKALSGPAVASVPVKTAPAPVAPPAAAPTPTTTNAQHFKFRLHIVCGAELPLNPGYGKYGKKQQAKRQAAAKRYPPNEPPNTYVTFQAQCCNAPTYKSHEGLVYATPIVERSTAPRWNTVFYVQVSADYLSNPQKLFVLKVWKKSALSGVGSSGSSTTTTNTTNTTTPTPLEDAIIGFAALNLNRNPGGWHNIVDFNGRVTGGLALHVQPMPNGFPAAANASTTSSTSPNSTTTSSASSSTSTANVDNAIDQFEQTMELRHLQLGQAIKRKFTELEQISNRLRTRLVDVTGERLQSPQYDVDAALDNWQSNDMQQCTEDDELVADFERALRTPTPELSDTEAEGELATPTPIPVPTSTAQSQPDAAGKE